MSINVTASPAPITVSASGTKIIASVSGSPVVEANISGGAGPPGPPGLSSLAGAIDAEFVALSDGDVLRYEQSRWRNYREENLVDGGNW